MLSSIDWFFKYENEGLILEDDILIDPEFINFAKKYLNSKNIGCISSCTYEDLLPKSDEKLIYAFLSKIPSIWGWYGNKKIWTEFRAFKRKKDSPFKYFYKLITKIPFWQSFVFAMILEYIDRGKMESWAYEFAYFLILNNKYSIYPSVSMSENIGNGEFAQNTSGITNLSPKLKKGKIKFKKGNYKPILLKKYMLKQSLNTPMFNTYKVQAIKGLISYLVRKALCIIKLPRMKVIIK